MAVAGKAASSNATTAAIGSAVRKKRSPGQAIRFGLLLEGRAGSPESDCVSVRLGGGAALMARG